MSLKNLNSLQQIIYYLKIIIRSEKYHLFSMKQYISITLFLLLALILQCQSKLVQAVSIFRHGARYQLSSLDGGDQYQPFWGQILGAGMSQHQRLGEMMRKQYIQNLEFLSPKYKKGEIEFYSTIINRTIQSLESQLYGLYPVGTGPSLLIVNRSLYLPPFTNKTDDYEHNFALPNGHQPIPYQFNQKFLKDNCDHQVQWYKKNIELQIDEYNEMNATYTPFIKKISSIFNLTGNITFGTITGLTSNIETSLHLGLPLPEELTDDDLKNLRHLTDWYHQITESKDLAKAANYQKFKKIFQVFDNRIKNSNSPLKMTFLSGHDTDLFPLYNDLNFSSSVCVEQMYRKGTTSALNCQRGAPFASSIIFQLHSENNVFNIKIRVNGKYMNLCGIKSTTCKYDTWKKLIINNLGTPQLVEQICGSEKISDEKEIEMDSNRSLWIEELYKIVNILP